MAAPGIKKDDKFSVYLYRPTTSSFRTEILAKGKILETSSGLKIDVRFDIPLWSIMAFIFIGSITLFYIWTFQNEITAMLITILLATLYILIVRSNHKDVKMEIENQFKKFKENISL